MLLLPHQALQTKTTLKQTWGKKSKTKHERCLMDREQNGQTKQNEEGFCVMHV